MKVAECGLIVHPDKGFLAASPDGIVHEVESGATGLLEIACTQNKTVLLQRPVKMMTSFAA